LPDVLDITQVALRRIELYIPGDHESNTASHTAGFTYYNFEILYRNEAGQLMRYKTRQLQGESSQRHFVDAVRLFIATNRAQASSLVTFDMLQDEIEVFDVPTEHHTIFTRSTYKPPKPQHIMVRDSTGYSAVHPVPVATGYSAVHPVPVATGYSAAQSVATAPPATPFQYTAVQIASQPEYDMY